MTAFLPSPSSLQRMNRIDPSTPSARSWRDIPQQIAPEAMSKVGRRRLTFGLVRTIALVVGLVVVALDFMPAAQHCSLHLHRADTDFEVEILTTV